MHCLRKLRLELLKHLEPTKTFDETINQLQQNTFMRNLIQGYNCEWFEDVVARYYCSLSKENITLYEDWKGTRIYLSFDVAILSNSIKQS